MEKNLENEMEPTIMALVGARVESFRGCTGFRYFCV